MTRAPPDASASSREHRRFRLPISLLLAVLLAGLVAVTAGAILALTWGASMRNTFEFLNQRSVDLIGQSRQALEGHLLPAERFARKTALSIERGAIEATDRLSFSRWLMGAMTINPQIRAIAVIGPDRTGWSVHRVFGPLAMETATRASPEIVAKAFEEAER
ncbi:MAG TPA: hypothetical protein VKA18_02055, partial [Alphaproteobacteria bacterium]|nr:hypothetical protein [Alphaproteobacteria bacterium]